MSTLRKLRETSGGPGRIWSLPLLVALAGLGLSACDSDDDGDGKAAEASKSGDPASGVEKIVNDAVDQAHAEAGAEHLFSPDDKSIRKRGCEFLTPDDVAGLFDVPAAELKQIKVMGCIYSWKKDDQVVEAKISMLQVHKTTEMAKTWFGNATANKTKEEVQAEMELVKEKLGERKELDTKLKKKTANDLAGLVQSNSEAQVYEDVPGLGDEARVAQSDGAIWIRVGNMTFNVGGYKGPPQPRVPFDPKNPKAIVQASMEAQKKWLAETHEQRKAAAMKVAPVVLKALEAL